jgi:hypothetical protein
MTTTTQKKLAKSYFTKVHKGVTFIGCSEQDVNDRIKNYEFNCSIFYKSSVYTFSCFARLLQDGTVEYTRFYNNGESKDVTVFVNKDEFWANV